MYDMTVLTQVKSDWPSCGHFFFNERSYVTVKRFVQMSKCSTWLWLSFIWIQFFSNNIWHEIQQCRCTRNIVAPCTRRCHNL